jgi:inorganic pyrophosphatase
MNLWKDLPAWDRDTNGAKITTLRAVIEIPLGSIIKYELSPKGDTFTAVREMNKRYRYIYNYGSIPGTLGGDNDPLDVIVIYPEPVLAGTVLNCKVVGVVKTIDKGEQDDKILAIPYFYKPKRLRWWLKKIIKYLNNYKYPDQKGTYITGLLGPEEAVELVNQAIINFKENVNEI